MDLNRRAAAHPRSCTAPSPGKESFANNCLLARRLAERGVRFIQLFDWGWDSHGASDSEALNSGFNEQCQDDRPPDRPPCSRTSSSAACSTTRWSSGAASSAAPRCARTAAAASMQFVGRDHNPNAFTIWMAGGGVKPGIHYGETDPIGYHVDDRPGPRPRPPRHAAAPLGFDHEKLIYPFQGLDQKLTGVKPAGVVKDIIA